MVIIPKTTYEERMVKSIEEEGFRLLSKSPLNSMVKDAKFIIKQICEVNKYRLTVSNPEVPMMYGLPKIHKEGDKMRKIASNVLSPLSKIAKWLVTDLKKFGEFEGFSVKKLV